MLEIEQNCGTKLSITIGTGSVDCRVSCDFKHGVTLGLVKKMTFFKKLEYNCFMMLCYFLLCNKVNQLNVYIHPLLLEAPVHPHHPTPLVCHRAPS